MRYVQYMIRKETRICIYNKNVILGRKLNQDKSRSVFPTALVLHVEGHLAQVTHYCRSCENAHKHLNKLEIK